jgi:hypothetical protein
MKMNAFFIMCDSLLYHFELGLLCEILKFDVVVEIVFSMLVNM